MTMFNYGAVRCAILLGCAGLSACGGSSTGSGGSGVYAGDAKGDGVVDAGKDGAPSKGDAVDVAILDQGATTDALQPGVLTDNHDGTLSDSGTGLMWQSKATSAYTDQQSASNACKNLTLADQSDWRLSTLAELRSLVVGCPATMSNGACDIVAGCVTCGNDACHGCTDWAGHGADGCYLDPLFSGSCTYFWSSDSVTGNEVFAWGVHFYNGRVSGFQKVDVNPYVCVR